MSQRENGTDIVRPLSRTLDRYETNATGAAHLPTGKGVSSVVHAVVRRHAWTSQLMQLMGNTHAS
jgi:uncharacterized membrane protein